MKKNQKHNFESKNLLDFINNRSIGLIKRVPKLSFTKTEKYLPFYWKPRYLNTQKHNKIFTSQWITNDSVVYGTKCNRLFSYNFENERSEEIPLIKGISREVQCPFIDEPATNFGIHAAKKNTSGTLLATGADNVNSVGIYKVPDLAPSYLLEDFHEDAVFDICWLDDSHIATCSRDSKMGIWNINPENGQFPVYYSQRSLSSSKSSSRSHEYPQVNKFSQNTNDEVDCSISCDHLIKTLRQPTARFHSHDTEQKFRAMEYLPTTSKLLIATMSSVLFSVDPIYFSDSIKSHDTYPTVIRDLVSIRQWPAEPHCFAVGGQARFTIYDSRCRLLPSTECINVLALQNNCGIRSLAFKDYVISYGTAEGHINFFDLRFNRHLTRSPSLYTSPSSLPRSQYQSPSNTTSTHYCVHPSSSSAAYVRQYMLNHHHSSHSPNNELAQLDVEGTVESGVINNIAIHPQTAIYTHEYDPSFTKLFAGGGPIAACINGQAACLFE